MATRKAIATTSTDGSAGYQTGATQQFWNDVILGARTIEVIDELTDQAPYRWSVLVDETFPYFVTGVRRPKEL